MSHIWPLPRTGIPTLLKTPLDLDGPMGMHSVEEQSRTFLGQKINIGRITEEYTHLKRISTNKDLEKRARSKAQTVKVVFDSTDRSERVIRKIPS